jgi:hypothetical protein
MPLPNRQTIETYDGQTKINGLIPPSVQSTDWDNPSLATCTSDVAALGQTAPRFLCRIQLASTTGALVLTTWFAQWGNVTPQTPVLARTGTGVFTITLPTVVSDEYDASVGISDNITVNLFAASANLDNISGTFGFINAQASGNVISIACADTTGAANDFATHHITVVAY